MTKKTTDEQKAFIAQSLGRWTEPTEIQRVLRDRWGVEIALQSIMHYDPTAWHKKNTGPAKKWCDLFWEARETAKKDLENIPLAHKAVRVAKLSDMAMKMAAKGNVGMASRLMEQIAKESGGAFTNKRELTGKDGKPLVPETPTDPAAIDARLSELLTTLGAGSAAEGGGQ